MLRFALFVLLGFPVLTMGCGNTIIDHAPILISLSSPIPRGQSETVTAKFVPNASCSITYTNPSGEATTALGLEDKQTSDDGRVSWTWTITPATEPGLALVLVKCGGARAEARFGIE